MNRSKKLKAIVAYIMPEETEEYIVNFYTDVLHNHYKNEYFGERLNWFQRMPLHWRYIYYMVGGVIIGSMVVLSVLYL